MFRWFRRQPLVEATATVPEDLPPVPEIPVQVFFDEIPQHCLSWIAEQDIIIGCVAWLTRRDIAEALNARPLCSLIMRHEQVEWMSTTSYLAYYDQVLQTCFSARTSYPDAVFADRYWLYPREPQASTKARRKRAHDPLIHHKFLVGCTAQPETDSLLLVPKPLTVWCGSWNMSVGAEKNRDSALIIPDELIARRYFDEWAKLIAESLPFRESVLVRKELNHSR